MAKSIHTQRQQRLCEFLIEARKKADLTQQEVAAHLAKPQSYVAKVEGGERRLDVIEFIELCDVIDIAPDKLVRKVARIAAS